MINVEHTTGRMANTYNNMLITFRHLLSQIHEHIQEIDISPSKLQTPKLRGNINYQFQHNQSFS